jgi:hypothetical protein
VERMEGVRIWRTREGLVGKAIEEKRSSCCWVGERKTRREEKISKYEAMVSGVAILIWEAKYWIAPRRHGSRKGCVKSRQVVRWFPEGGLGQAGGGTFKAIFEGFDGQNALSIRTHTLLE